MQKSLAGLWPHALEKLAIESVRGNIPTRLRKLLESDEADALVVAKAALDRLMSAGPEFQDVQKLLKGYLAQLDWMCLPLSLFPTAPAQGALALQLYKKNSPWLRIFDGIRNHSMERQVLAERARLQAIGGGCHQKLGCSIVALEAGDFQYFRYEKPSGEEVHECNWLRDVPHPPQDLWSTANWGKFKKVTELPWPGELKSAEMLLVAKAIALPKDFHPDTRQILWAAGIETHRKLAARGFWVNGSSDSQGLGLPELAFLGKHDFSFRKLTHEGAVRDKLDIATYRIEWPEELPLPDKMNAFYFGSAFEAREFLRRYKSQVGDHWYCGLGRSYSEIQKILPPGVQLTAIWEKI